MVSLRWCKIVNKTLCAFYHNTPSASPCTSTHRGATGRSICFVEPDAAQYLLRSVAENCDMGNCTLWESVWSRGVLCKTRGHKAQSIHLWILKWLHWTGLGTDRAATAAQHWCARWKRSSRWEHCRCVTDGGGRLSFENRFLCIK